MNCVIIERCGNIFRFRGGSLDGRLFNKGEMLFINGDSISFTPKDFDTLLGSWFLQRTVFRGKPAVVVGFFDKRTGGPVQRYIKIINDENTYMCGPRYPRRICEEIVERKLAA